MKAQISDIFFDLDHTLWDFEKNSALTFEVIFKNKNISIGLPTFLDVYIPLNYQYWERFRKGEITQQELRIGRLRDSFLALQYPVTDELLFELSQQYIENLPNHNYLFDGALEILDYLSTKYKLHIITNGFDQVQTRKIENSGLTKYFQTVTNSEMAGVKKPDPLIFEYALQQAQAEKTSSIMIGDCIDADVKGAMGCGIDAILFHQENCAEVGIKQIKHLVELKNYL